MDPYYVTKTLGVEQVTNTQMFTIFTV